MQRERVKLSEMLKSTNVRGAGEAASLALILPRLQEIGIQPKKLVTFKDKGVVIMKTMNECGVIFLEPPDLPEGTEANVKITLPALVLLSDESGRSHFWFCKDKRTFEEEMKNPRITKYWDIPGTYVLF